MKSPRLLSIITLLSLAFLPMTYSQEKSMAKKDKDAEKTSDSDKEEKDKKNDDFGKEQSSVTENSGTFGGEVIDYTATAGTIVLKKDEKDPHASIFYVAYTKKGVEDPAERPIVYCFNGGPGSSAVWLHLGGFGPKRVAMNADGTQPAPPYRVVDNPMSILKVADLVFIDPVSTGFSRANEQKAAKDFHEYEGDLNSVAEFIRLYTTRNNRWLSPKFLAGESYGSFRAAGVCEVLRDRYGMYLNGIVLVSGVLGFDTLWGTDLAHICFLPALSNVAAFHGKLKGDYADNDERRRTEAEAFAKGDYALALLQGVKLAPEKKLEVAKKLSDFTGLDADLIERLNLRIDPSRFREELLRGEREMIGRFDGRIVGKDSNLAADSPDFDPSYSSVYGAFSAAQNHYLRTELKFESDLVYEVLSRKVHPWDYSKAFVGKPVDVSGKLARALSENKHLQIMVNCGHHDLATPYFSIQHTLDHLDVAPELIENNIRYTYYDGGHMMYTIEESNTQWNKDVAAFILEAIPE